jgi:hypothetical protein
MGYTGQASPRSCAQRCAIDDPALLSQFARSKFIPAKNSDYGPIEEVGKLTNLLN